MDIEQLEKLTSRLVSRGIISKYTCAQIVNSFSENEEKRPVICENLKRIDSLNDEDNEFFIKLNQLINEMLF